MTAAFIFPTVCLVAVTVATVNAQLFGGGCGGGMGLPPAPAPLFPSPCQPRPFIPPPVPPPMPLPQPYGYPCATGCAPRFGQSPYVQTPVQTLPQLLQPPRPYSELPPEEYLNLPSDKLVKETMFKKTLPDPFDDLKRPVPIIPDKLPETIKTSYASPLSQVAQMAGGCFGGYYPQNSYGYGVYGQQHQLRPYPYYPQRPSPYPAGPVPLPSPMSCCARCGGCGGFRAFGGKTVRNETETVLQGQSQEVQGVDGDATTRTTTETAGETGLQCNDEKLRALMKKSFTLSLKEAKLAIHNAAEAEFGPQFQVVCSADDFEYITRSSIHCQVELQKGVCYAFRTG